MSPFWSHLKRVQKKKKILSLKNYTKSDTRSTQNQGQG